VFATGTSVRFLVDAGLVPAAVVIDDLLPMPAGFGHLEVRLVGEAAAGSH